MFNTNDMMGPMMLSDIFDPIPESSTANSSPVSASPRQCLSVSSAPLKLDEGEFTENSSLVKDIFDNASWRSAFKGPLCLTSMNSGSFSDMDKDEPTTSRSRDGSIIFSELGNFSRSTSPIPCDQRDSFGDDANMMLSQAMEIHSGVEEPAVESCRSWEEPESCCSNLADLVRRNRECRKSEPRTSNISSELRSSELNELSKVMEELSVFRREALKMQALHEQQKEEIDSLGRSLETLERERISATDALAEVSAELQLEKQKNRKNVTDLWRKIQLIDDENVQLTKINAELEKRAETPSIDIQLCKTTTLWNSKLEQDKLDKDRADQKIAQEKTKARAGKQKEKLSAWMDRRSRSSVNGSGSKSTSTSPSAPKSSSLTSTRFAKQPKQRVAVNSRFRRFKNRANKA